MGSSNHTEVPSTEVNNNNAEMECIASPVSMLKILMDTERYAMQEKQQIRCVSEFICHQHLHQNSSQCQEDHKQATTKNEDVFVSNRKRGRPPGSGRYDSTGVTKRERNTIAEKRRREKLNESIRALRSAVPFITKMDKLSTFKDAITYVRDLQSQTNTLLNEIQDLQSSSSPLFEETKPLRTLFSNLRDVQVMKVDDHTFHLTLEVTKIPNVVAHIEKAVASICKLNITAENFLVTQDGVIKNIWVKMGNLADANLEEKLKSMIVDAFATYNYDV